MKAGNLSDVLGVKTDASRRVVDAWFSYVSHAEKNTAINVTTTGNMYMKVKMYFILFRIINISALGN